MEPLLPDGSIVLFRRPKGVAKGDVVLVDHPELGRTIRKVRAVGIKGNVHLRGLARNADEGCESQPIDRVPRDLVVGVMSRRLG